MSDLIFAIYLHAKSLQPTVVNNIPTSLPYKRFVCLIPRALQPQYTTYYDGASVHLIDSLPAAGATGGGGGSTCPSNKSHKLIACSTPGGSASGVE